MRMYKKDLALYAGIACTLWSFAGPSTAQNGSIQWLDNYSEALREAKRTQKPIFLEFRCEP